MNFRQVLNFLFARFDELGIPSNMHAIHLQRLVDMVMNCHIAEIDSGLIVDSDYEEKEAEQKQ